MSSRKETREPGQTRREFCTRACQFASVAAVGGMLSRCGGGSPTSPSGIGSPLTVLTATRTNGVTTLTVDASSPLNTVGGMAIVQATGVVLLVSRTAQNTFTALTAICTHQTCTITGFDSGLYVCPCHGSEFDTGGRVVRGPAPTALHQYPTQFSNGVLTISA